MGYRSGYLELAVGKIARLPPGWHRPLAVHSGAHWGGFAATRSMREDRGMVLDALRALPPTPMLILAFVFPALEASTMLGVVFPGEIAILVAGAAAQVGTLPLWAVATEGTPVRL